MEICIKQVDVLQQFIFESKTVNQSDVYVSGEYADVLIDKGTDAGGAIEVYKNVEDAEKRRDYLATYDGTIFANGTHTVIGTRLSESIQ